MIDRLEILVSRLRRLVSRNRWSASLLGLPRSVDSDHGPGLVLIQIDGLGEGLLREAIDSGRMPFVAHLVRDEGYRTNALYTGLPSSTPGFQAEFFYGARTAVPAFGFFDRSIRRHLSMNEPFSASIIEHRLLEKHKGLLQGGSSWSNVFSGDASEAHFCAATAGLDTLLRTLHPLRLIGLVVWNLLSLVRIAWTMLVETVVALWDFLRGTLSRHNLLSELLFIPERVIVTAIMREVVTAGACVDIERGLRVVQINLLGYDEHAHHRGPRSGVARWTLKGIDRSIKRIWMAAHRSPLRDYQVWLYSDHGQEVTRPWSDVNDTPFQQAVRRAIQEVLPPEEPDPDGDGTHGHARSEAGRSRWFRMELPDWLRRKPAPRDLDAERSHAADAGRPEDVTILGEGPVGSVTLPEEVPFDTLQELARAVAETARVPLVLYVSPDGEIRVHRSDGSRLRLPEDAAEVFGADHPHLQAIREDCVRLVKHEHAGDLVLMGFDPDTPASLQFERGAHGGPGPVETSAFVVLPPELRAVPGNLRPDGLRSIALHVLEGRLRPSITQSGTFSPLESPPETTVRVMTYNVHGCRGMDGRYSPHRIARVIAQQEPDIVCLQELDVERGRSGQWDQARTIAQMLQSEYHFHAVNTLEDGAFGNAVLSVHPSRRIDAGPLPQWRPRMNLEPRGVLWVEVEVQGVALQIINTHLSIVHWERLLQVDALLGDRWLQRSPVTGPRILCGDFNASGRSRDLQRIDAVLRNVGSAGDDDRNDQQLKTWSSRVPMRRIDHVFVSPEVPVKTVYVPRSRLTQAASDHLPLVADLGLQDRNPPSL